MGWINKEPLAGRINKEPGRIDEELLRRNLDNSYELRRTSRTGTLSKPTYLQHFSPETKPHAAPTYVAHLAIANSILFVKTRS